MSYYFNNLLGKRFGRLIVIQKTSRRKFHCIVWICKCNCGKIVAVNGFNLVQGSTKSCGCLNDEVRRQRGLNRKIHGKSLSKVYRAYRSMLDRCYNLNNKNYPNWGGRGIKVCKRWLGKSGFINFYKDMGDPPRGTSLDRYPNNDTGNYKPSNCRWATQSEQCRNKRDSAKTKNLKKHNFLKHAIQEMIQRLINGKPFRCSKYIKYLGCSSDQFLQYIQFKFEPWMNWNNYGHYRLNRKQVWNIDHIIPCGKFDLSLVKDRYECFSYINLRPFLGKDNATLRLR